MQSPKSLYETCLDVFCEHIHNWSQPLESLGQSSSSLSNPALSRLVNIENRPQVIYSLNESQLRPTSDQWMLASRPSSTDNLATNNNHHYDDKLGLFKKSCHNLMSTFFGKKSQSESDVENNCDSINHLASSTSSNHHLFFRVSSNVCEDIIRRLQNNFRINDRALSFPLFDGEINRIVSFQVDDASRITSTGLKVFKKHKITKLKVSNLSNCSLTELVNNLSSWTISNLEYLSIPWSSLSRYNKICIMLSVTRFSNLVHLNISNTTFNDQCLDILTDHLTSLKSLDLSSTRITQLRPLIKLPHLTHLILHNISLSCKDESTYGDLIGLKYLDISDDRYPTENYMKKDKIRKFFDCFARLPNLVELDLSGRKVKALDVFSLVKRKTQESRRGDSKFQPLRFIGLIMTDFSFNEMIDLNFRTMNKLTMSGNGKLPHIIEALRRYKNRRKFVHRALFHLFHYTLLGNADEVSAPSQEEIDLFFNNQYFDDDENYDYDDTTDSKEIIYQVKILQPNELNCYRARLIDLVVDIMEINIKAQEVIFIATGTLYNLTKNKTNLHPHLLRRVVDICLDTMSYHPSDYQIMKNSLLTLCSDKILQDVTFDRYTCIRLVLDSLFTFHEITVNRLALGICAVLAAKIPTVDNELLGSQTIYLKRLLDLVEENYALPSESSEVILKLSLSALWNFTDEAPKTCETFIKHNGLQIYIDTLVLFEEKGNIETKILGLLNNIAEVSHLRGHLIEPRLLLQLKKLIYSDQIDVSYFAIGILAQLASDPKLIWENIDDFELEEILKQMFEQIQVWPNPSFEMVAYRSFVPFIALLLNDRHLSIPLWALWAIHHVCTKNASKYCRMLHEERCVQTIVLILNQRMQQQYGIYCAKQRQRLSVRLVNLTVVSDDKTEILSKVTTEWNCNLINDWNLAEEEIAGTDSTIKRDCLNHCDSTKKNDSMGKLSNDGCDCMLKHYLDSDPFIRLPATILKAFQCFSPIPLRLDC